MKTQWKMKLLLTDDGMVDSVEGELITLTDFDPFSVGVPPSLQITSHIHVILWAVYMQFLVASFAFSLACKTPTQAQQSGAVGGKG